MTLIILNIISNMFAIFKEVFDKVLVNSAAITLKSGKKVNRFITQGLSYVET